MKEKKYYKKALEFINSHDLNQMPIGKHAIDEDNVWVNIVEGQLKDVDDAKLEVHNKYIDIQISLSAPETFGLKNREGCKYPLSEFDVINDILLYKDPILTTVTKEPGQMIVFYPNDAHAPMIGQGVIKKAIFKVLYEV